MPAEFIRAGAPVFVKRIPLTHLERRPEHAGSTANLFGLPVCYQYGVGSTGFGAEAAPGLRPAAHRPVRAGGSADERLLRPSGGRPEDDPVPGSGTAPSRRHDPPCRSPVSGS